MRKAVRISGGIVLVLVGLILAIPGVPGPGLFIVFLGLVLLAEHFRWARRLLDWGKTKWESIPQVKQRMERKSASREEARK
ncbi:MAG: PGPGW domain-containing protein [Bryobacterales bacterium]|nr:PGPGW domain-containing protein [Bryobacterales bacterium]MCZ2148957.1 PGPGW domain-containing protein [Bryobacterales bacterium]